MFATGPRRRKGLEFVCLFGHDGHRQHARLDARRVQEVVTLPRAFWRFVVRTSVDLECFYPHAGARRIGLDRPVLRKKSIQR